MLLSEAVRSIGSSLSTTIAATMTVLIGMFLLGVLLAFGTYARSWSDQTKDQLLNKIFFCTEATCGREATEKEINAVRVTLETNPLVKEFEFVSKRVALDRMEKSHPQLVRNLPANPLPHSYEVKPVTGEQTEAVANSLHPFPKGVEKVCPPPPGVKLAYTKDDCGRKTTRRVLEVARVIESVSIAGVLILLAAATLLIANTIRLSLFARRREIEVMKLVGASNWFVRGPFMLEGLICGLIGSAAAVLLLLLGKEFALPALNWFDDPNVEALPFVVNAAILVGVGLLLGAAGSGVTLRRFLRV